MLHRRRICLSKVAGTLGSFPACLIVGPRQCGKTTLARSMPGEYFDLESESDRSRLEASWHEVLSNDRMSVFDEAQAMPELFPRLRAAIDERRGRKGRFLLLGSVAPSIMRQVSESLAGRVGVVELTPFQTWELPRSRLLELWRLGGYPDGGILRGSRARSGDPFRWHRDYLALLAQRDLPLWGLPSRPQETLRLFRMLAAVNGSAWNASEIGKSLGRSYHTVFRAMDYLEGAFLVRFLRPLHRNLKKRLVKTPRFYWRDSGLLHSFLGLSSLEQLLSSPACGSSWEGFVIQQILSALQAWGIPCEASYFRSSDDKEVDLVLEKGNQTWAIEIKLSSSPRSGALEELNRVADLIGADGRILLSRSPLTAGKIETGVATDLFGALGLLRKRFAR